MIGEVLNALSAPTADYINLLLAKLEQLSIIGVNFKLLFYISRHMF